MDEQLMLLTDKSDRFSRVVGAVPAEQWDAPSPCAGWTAADVVDHVVDSQRDFLERQDLGLDERPRGAPEQVWTHHVTALRRRLGDGADLRREYDGYFGTTTIGATLVDFYVFDLIVHRWDIAASVGRDERFTEAELDQMEASMKVFGDALYAEGVCAAPVPVPADASRQDRVLGLLGRDPATPAR
ncbi:TIGR03086 family metal-binding protein [Nocardioides sp.]|uniref:TIGR03086 family metal-binding protein n=1 Tax=Nocardioides sp. TaxID=35761 RepID=UPI0027336EB2|nr:TIGR03086 family metal-binding protein [Nocardioides sp.]MDP3890559.1 TIGR03086 family metal-binding protein [Nocardioides sp.]